MEKKVKVGEVVWAKVKGFPWWPGMIGKIEESITALQETKILVNFIGHPSHAIIPISKIEKFDKKYKEFSRTKKKTLLNSIYLANKIMKGELSFNNHLKNRKPEENMEMESSRSNPKNKTLSDTSSISSADEKRKTFLNHKRLRKFLDENNHHLDDNQYSKRSKSNISLNDNHNNLIRQTTATTKADSCVEAMLMENGRKKDLRDDNRIQEFSDGMIEDLEDKIKELFLSKIELPSSSLNKSMIIILDQIYEMIEKINTDDFYELIKDLVSFLNCLIINKNEYLSSRALSLSNLIRKKMLNNIFQFTERIFLDEDCLDIDLEEMNNEITKLLEEEENKAINKNCIHKQTNVKSNSNKISKNREKKSAFVTNLNHIPLINLNMNIEYSNNEEQAEIHSVSEISLDSHKTDCEETKAIRSKILIKPLDYHSICEILLEYFIDVKICKLDHDDLIEILVKKEFFDYIYQDKEKSLKLIKCHYMRKRVCYKLYKVFDKLLKLIRLDKDTIKNLSIYLEMKAREKDPEMGDQYKNYISAIFHKIKDKLIVSNLNLPSLTSKTN